MSGDFFFLRKVPVDLSKYLPAYLYGDEIFSAIQNALNIEHEKYRLKLPQVAKNLFIETADLDGLKDFAKVLNLKINPEWDIERLRSIIRVKWNKQVLTKENLIELMKEHSRIFGSVEVEEMAESKLKLISTNTDFYWSELMAELWERLPAHVIFDFDINSELPDEKIYFGQAGVAAEKFDLDLTYDAPKMELVAAVYQYDTSRIETDIKPPEEKFAQELKLSTPMQMFESLEIDCEKDGVDEQTAAIFERWLRERWLKWKNAQIIRHYHEDDGEIYNPDDEEYFPTDTDFLRIYWQFGCSDNPFHLRYQTILKPREDLKAADINYLSDIGASSQMLLHSRTEKPTTGIIKAIYIQRSELKIL